MPLRQYLSHAMAPDDVGAALRYRMLLIVWAALATLGLIGLGLFAWQGHLAAGYGSYAPWGLWIALYFHGVGIAAGGVMIAALGFVLDRPGFSSRRALRLGIGLGVAAILPGLFAVFLDLGRMDRAWRILVTPNFASMMAFNSWLYGVFLVALASAWFLSVRPRTEWLRPVLLFVVILAVMVPSQSGAFFGVVGAKAAWNSGVMPVLFLAAAVTSGAAALLFVRGVLAFGASSADAAEHRAAMSLLRTVVLTGIGVYFLLEFADYSLALWSAGGHAESVRLVLFGPYWWVFWGVHLILGGLLPAVLLMRGKTTQWIVAGLLVAVSFVSGRLNVLVPGQALHELRGLEEAFVHPRLTHFYEATLMEYLVGLLLPALGIAILFVGLRLERWAARLEVNR